MTRTKSWGECVEHYRGPLLFFADACVNLGMPAYFITRGIAT
jgi:hypothetical protein